jgi:hypothetical protein
MVIRRATENQPHGNTARHNPRRTHTSIVPLYPIFFVTHFQEHHSFLGYRGTTFHTVIWCGIYRNNIKRRHTIKKQRLSGITARRCDSTPDKTVCRFKSFFSHYIISKKVKYIVIIPSITKNLKLYRVL